jgi:hypothetical protein
MKVVLHTRPDDERCAKAQRALEDAKGRLAFELSLCDATDDSRYQARVPVVAADGRELAWDAGDPQRWSGR